MALGQKQTSGRRGCVDDLRTEPGYSGARQVSWSKVGSVEALGLDLGSNPAFDSY